MRIVRAGFGALMVTVLAAVAGCAADPNSGRGRYAMLEVIGAEERELAQGDEERVEFLYSWSDGNPIQGVVSFSLAGVSGGATVSANSAMTDSAGRAHVTVRPLNLASFELLATAEQVSEPTVVLVHVVQPDFGNIIYTPRYSGTRGVRSLESGLFTNTTCEDLTRSVPYAEQVQYPRLGIASTYEAVEVAATHALYVLAIDRNDRVAAEGCRDVTLTGPSATVEVGLDDVPDLYGGRYRIQETFNVTSGFTGTLDLILDIFGGLATSPGTMLVNLILANAGVDEDTRDMVDNFDFLVVPLIDALWDSVDIPAPVAEVIDLGGDLNAAFSNMTFNGVLDFPEPATEISVTGTHRLESIMIPVDGATVEKPLHLESSVEVKLGDRLELGEHSFAIPFGELFELVLNDVLLPRLPGAPHSMGDLLGQAFACETQTDTLTRQVCEAAADAAGTIITEQIGTMFEYETLYLKGEGDLTDMNEDYIRDHIVGDAQARWVGDSGEMKFPGTFVGDRIDGRQRDRNPIRERLRPTSEPR